MFQTATRTHVGTQRSVNEDAVFTQRFDSPEGDAFLLAVADGMGGHEAGDVASETALSALSETIEDSVATSDTPPQGILQDGVETAHELVHDRGSGEDGRMGTTLVAALIRDRMAHIINVGDSRCYHIEEGSLSQITVDHSLVQEMVDDGMIDPEEAGTHPQRNVVTQALGTSDAIEPDHYSVELSGTLLLCSDGLTEEVDEETIRVTITNTEKLERAAAQLVAQANENGGSDNISVVLGRW